MPNILPIAEMTNGIILAQFTKNQRDSSKYQTEAQLEEKFIADLANQGYERVHLTTQEALLCNLKDKIEKLNHVIFLQDEWQRFLDEYLNPLSDSMEDKARKIAEDYINDFIFNDGTIRNIKIIDKTNINNNSLQVAHQIEQQGKHKNRYDVTILVNGLPLVHIELKKRGVNLQEAFNQIHRYSKESFNTQHSLFKFVQIFVISNGTYTKYFANTTAKNKNHYEFACQWADAKNQTIDDLEDFTATFFEKRVLLEILIKYCVFTSENTLLIMRPYQIAATERILWKIKSSYENKNWGKPEAGGFIWHTTGSGKTLTSFKVARLATELNFIKKVFFVVDRKDLDYQTMLEYKKFQEDSVNGSKDTKALKKNIENKDGKIIVTTIQKLNEFIKQNKNHAIYDEQVVFIFDECHRSQFGEAQKNIKQHFKKYYQFGFTGTPIFPENASGDKTTADVFGAQLHSYVITDAIRDEKVLKFKVDYNNVLPAFKSAETENDFENLKKLESKMFLHPERIKSVTEHILKVFDAKTHRNDIYTIKEKALRGFNAMFAVQSIEAAKLYYEEFEKQQKDIPENKKLRVATIYSFAQNEEQAAIGEILDEQFETTALNSSSKEFLDKVISNYNKEFKTNYSTESSQFQDYYKDLSKKVKEKEIDIVIVVGMFLTGFDAPTLNTLFVDKNLRYHGLIQAYSRTNRILNKIKVFGNIVCFRDLEQATKDAIRTFGDENNINIILEKPYHDYMYGYEDATMHIKGYEEICVEMLDKFKDPLSITLQADKKEFAKLFGELLKAENILKNFDEFQNNDALIPEGLMQDYRSVYVSIKDEIQKQKASDKAQTEQIDFSDVEFEIELLKTDEINLDYILGLIFEKTQENKNKNEIKEDITKILRANIGTRAKEELVIDFIDKINIEKIAQKETILKEFYTYAEKEKLKEIQNLIANEHLKTNSEKFIEKSIQDGYVSSQGTELDSILPSTSRKGGEREKKKGSILEKIQKLVYKFLDI